MNIIWKNLEFESQHMETFFVTYMLLLLNWKNIIFIFQVELMKRLKEENKKAREAERNNLKRLAGMEKITRFVIDLLLFLIVFALAANRRIRFVC